MALTFSEPELAFRDELRAWFADYDPGPEPFGDEDAHYAWRRGFQRELARDGWAAVHWPPEYGGRGATLTQSAIFFEELGRSGAPLPANVLGLLLAGPTIMTWGTPDQKDRYLTPILTAEEIWCQGFSEPDAGSDLASLKTRAGKDGSEFNELFIDGARIPDENVLGGVGNGWKVALTTLMNERAGLAFFLQVRLRQLLDSLFAEGAGRGRLDDPVVADKLGEFHLRCEVLRLTAYRGLTAIEKYG